jgi:glutamyl-tRNA(Gln) amidotransferase subunit D
MATAQTGLFEIKTKNGELTGNVMPNSSKSTLFVKLKTGYNIGIKRSNVLNLKSIKEHKKIKQAIEIKQDKTRPLISVLHTGGTIASRVNYSTGGVSAAFGAGDFLAMFPEIKELANINSVFVANIMSEDIRFKHYRLLTSYILKEIKKGVKGIIIGHGTDTLAITAAALSFIFENIPIPILLVGSQRSSDRGSSDAAVNLTCAVEFIIHSDFTGVAICMHETINDENCVILSGTKTRKMHTSRRDAFKCINSGPIARINYAARKVTMLTGNYQKNSSRKLITRNRFEEKVAVIKTFPNMSSDFVDVLIKKKYKGLILEGSGIGQAPTNIKENLPVYNALRTFIKRGGIIVLTSQCIFGSVHPFIYANCRRLYDIGVIFGSDMLTETAFIKLAWLLGNYKDKNEIKALMLTNLRGEVENHARIWSV